MPKLVPQPEWFSRLVPGSILVTPGGRERKVLHITKRASGRIMFVDVEPTGIQETQDEGKVTLTVAVLNQHTLKE